MPGVGVAIGPGFGGQRRGAVLPPLLDVSFLAGAYAQPMPTTAEEWTAAIPTVTAPTHAVRFAGAGAATDGIGGVVFAPSAAPAPLAGVGVGLGADMLAGVAGFDKQAGQHFDGGTTTCDPGSASFAILVIFRSPRRLHGGYLVSKRVGAGPGYAIWINSANGRITGTVDVAAATNSAITAVIPDDGAWHCALLVANHTAGVHTLFTDVGTAPNGALEAGSVSSASPLRIGADSAGGGAGHQQIAYVAMWIGAAAEALNAASLSAIWKHGSDPTGRCDQWSRASLASSATDAAGHVATWYGAADVRDQGAIAYIDGLYGAQVESAKTNLIYPSREFGTAWTAASLTVGAFAAESPGGMKDADSLTAGGDGATIRSVAGVTVAASSYTGSVWLRCASGTVGANLRLNRSDTHVELAAQACTVTTSWQRFSVAGTAATTGTELEIELLVGATVVYAWGAQLELGPLSSEIPTKTAAVTRAANSVGVTNTGGAYYSEAAGRCEVVCRPFTDAHPGEDRFVWTAHDIAGADSADRHFVDIDQTNRYPRHRIHDGAGTEVVAYQDDSPPASWGAQHTITCRWQSATGACSLDVSGDATARTSPAAWTPGDSGDIVWLGMRHTSTAQIDGVIHRLRIWNAP